MAAKQFIKYLSSFGHPKPFKTESESDVHSDIRYCVDALNVYKRGNDKLMKTKVAAMVSNGIHLRKQLTSIFEALILKEDNYETVKDRIQSLRVALIQKGILEEQFESMETDEPKPSTVVRGQTVKQSVELWPLFEHTSILCEYLVFTKKDNSVSLRNLTDFMLKYTPSSIVHLLQQQLPENVLYEEMLGVVMGRMWYSAATCDYDTWLKWNRPFQTEEELVTDRRRGPGNLHLLPLSYPLFTILSSKHNNPREASYLPLHVPLGGVNDQLDKLSQITSHLWSTNCALSSPRFDIRYIECQHLISSFLKMLESFGSLLEPNQQQQWHDVMVEVLSRKREQQLTCDDIRLIQSLFQEVGPSVEHPAVSLISRCFEIIMEPGIVESSCLNMVIIGVGLAYVGVASVYLLAPIGPVDPVEKQAIKLNNYQNRLNEVELEIQVFEMHLKLKTGQTITDIEDNNRHIRLQYLLERRTQLIDDIEILQEQQAYRPDPLQFQSLIHDVKAFLESVGSIDRVTSLLSKLKSANQLLLERRSDMVAITTSLREEEAWQLTLHSFLDGLDKEYWYYPDLIKPFMTAVQQMRLGISILAQKVEMEQKQSALPKQIYGQTLEDVVLVLSQFPTMSGSYETFHDLTKCLIYDTTSELVNNSLKTPDTDNNQDVLSKLLMCGLYLVKLHCFHRGELTADITLTLSNLFGAFVSAWQDQEDRRRKKEAEDASLYRFRSKTHGDERTEEEKEEAEFKSSFPSFEKEYADLVGPQTLEEVGQLTEDDDDVASHIDSITTEEMYTVYRIHDLLFTSLVSTDWLTQKPHTPCTSEEYLQPAMLGYSIAARVAQKSLGTLGRDVDLGVVGGHLVISGVVQQTILSSLNSTDATQDENLCLKPSEFYDVYYDSNVAEVSQCKGVLDRFIIRLEELLVEFPEHPTLLQILAIIERILSFSITCPIMKFLVGLELLLEKSKDWEANAAKHVSIMPNFTEVSAMVVQWRKLELGCWKNTMLLEERKCEKSVSKWWFHLYQLITSYLDQTQKSVDSVELLTSLKQFLEKSNLGEFKSRLQMIYALHCQVYKMDTSEKQVEVLNMLWNLYQFYHQYLPNVEAEITSQKTPIQKQLKGFVKIARWSDLNYWALKQSTEKTHRMVHKYAKKYEVILNQPVTKLLGDRGDNLSILTPENQSKGSVLCERLEVYRQMIKTKTQPKTILREIEEAVTLSDLQTRLPVLIPRLSKHWKSLVTSLNYTQLLSTLDSFTGNIVENVHELQKAEIPQGDDKEKQKKEAKFLNLRKRKSLSELFKYLTKMGLSYRKGLVLEEDTQQLDSLSLQPLDVTAAMSKHKSVGGEVLSSQWENCQEYFYRCITRKAQLDQAILQPAADLGLGNSERCRGFSTHLHHLFTKQRQELGETFNNYITLRKFLSELRNITKSNDTSLPPQNHLKLWLERLKVLTVQLLEGLNQYLLLLYACPRHRNDGNDYISPLCIEELSPMSKVKKEDPLWQQCVDTIKELISNTSTEHKKLLRLSDKLFLLWKDFDIVENVSIVLRSTSEKLSTMSNLFKDPVSGTSCALNEPLNILEENITSCMGEFQDWTETSKNPVVMTEELVSSDSSDTDIATGVDSVIENVLLTVQKLLTHHAVIDSTKDGDETKSAAEELENEENDDIIEGHLVTGLISDLKTDLHELRSAQISTLVRSLVEKIEAMFNEDTSKPVGKTGLVLLLRSYPLLERYCEITEYYLAHVIGSHRSCGKLLSVLLALFTELAMKGFCVPPELSDEMEKEGATDFKDIEQGGLGEGEGVKDVSDQIETEDQLDDARKAGEEKKEEDDNPNVAPEDNAIEMSDDFDGKPQDLEQEGEDDKDDDKDEDEDDDIEKQMGELDEKDTDKLDEQLWGSDEEDEQEPEENPKDETGPGDGQKEENQLVAKDDNQDKTTDKKQEEDKQQQEEKEEDQIHDMEDIQEEGYNEDKVDANQGDSKEPDPVPESMELPEDLNLDADEGGEKEEETEMEDPAEGKEDEGEITEETSDDKPEEGEEENPEKDEESKKDDEKDNQDGVEEEKEEAGDKGVDNPEDIGKDEEDRKEEEGKGDPGFTADDEEKDDGETEEEMKDKDDKSEKIETHGKTSHDTPNIEESDTAQDDAAKADNQQEEKVGSGMADTQQDEGHEGEKSSEVTQGSNKNRKEKKRQPGKSDEDRSLGVPDQSYKRLKTSDETSHDQEEEEKNQEKKEGDIYEHIKDSKSHHDAQTLDAATDEQLEKQSVLKEEKEDKPEEQTDDIKPMEEEDNQEDDMEVEKKESNKVKGKKTEQGLEDMNMEMKMEEEMDMDREKVEIEGERVLTMTVGRGPESTIHTAIENLHLDSTPSEIDLEKIRADLEENVSLWSHQSLTTPEQMAEASLAWQRYEALTSSLSQELCEQLRLVLEPSQATKLKGDYRTGKRLNMRKVIPYIASQFRKDKIWLRRTKPSKRQYQIMLAIDDSSSMLDNHSKQLAFESLAVISNALTLLESGDLAISSFGESVKLLHSFTDQFSSQSGANILHQFTFEQKKTKIAQLLQQATSIMVDARSRQHGVIGNPETSQLLLIVSDGRGLFSEGMEVVKSAVRKARDANIFLVFVIIDNPENKDSILDIRVPIFKSLGKLPEIKSYMEEFPFPFYIILRDINSLPITLSDALRQWFELVTAGDR
ncbi:midasin [Patella vulgata]|uniref:midasin n=1 Tax=Patella vulgata TaxID=6465 RepID=UPI0024A87026|nr:midasin [Patella vulgata]